MSATADSAGKVVFHFDPFIQGGASIGVLFISYVRGAISPSSQTIGFAIKRAANQSLGDTVSTGLVLIP